MIGLNSVFNSRGSSLMRGLPGSLARRLRQHNLISHRHDPSRPATQSCGSSGHARCANSLTGRLGRIRHLCKGRGCCKVYGQEQRFLLQRCLRRP